MLRKVGLLAVKWAAEGAGKRETLVYCDAKPALWAKEMLVFC